MVMDDLRRAGQAAIETKGDAKVRSALRGYMHELPALDANAMLEAQLRRFDIAREWSLFLDRYDVLLMPVSWQRQLPIDADHGDPAVVSRLLSVQSPLLTTAMLGLPGLSVPTGMAGHLPAGVQIVATRFREDRALRAGAIIERAARFDAIDHLP
jgi:amidase